MAHPAAPQRVRGLQICCAALRRKHSGRKDMMKHKHEPVAAGNWCHPEQLLFEEMQVILAKMKRVHKERARLLEQTLALNSELASMIRGRGDASVAATQIDSRIASAGPSCSAALS